MPSGVSDLSFLFITSLIGFLILFLVFFNELFRIDRNHIFQCFLLSTEVFSFNFFLLLGIDGLDMTVVSSIVSSYFAFIPIIEYILFKSKPKLNTVIAIIISIIGVFMIIGFNVNSFMNIKILYLLLADISIALYMITTGQFAKASNPAILSMGQLFFVTIFSFIGWFVESTVFNGGAMRFPTDALFWGSVVFISFFIRGLYTVVQVYAQRYLSPINVSLIFATEIIMTLFLSRIISSFFGFMQEIEPITIIKCIGAVFMVTGILICDNSFYEFIIKKIGVSNGKA